MSAEDWDVFLRASTVEGDVVLRMTSEQADELRDSLIWLTGANAGDPR